MKTTYKLGLIAAGIITTGLIVAGTASAASGNGFGFERMLSEKAEILGISGDELQSQLGEKTFLEIAEEQGVNQDTFHEAMETKARARWEEVGLSEEEITERLRQREERQASCDGSGPLMNGEGGEGFGKGGSHGKGFGQGLAQ